MIEEAIFTRGSSFAGLTALIGTPPNCRLYPRLMPEEPTYPAVIYVRISAPRETAMGSDPGLVHARFQFDVRDSDPTSVRNVTEQLRLAFERWRGTNLGGNGLTVQDTFIENQQDAPPELVDAVAVHRSILDVLIHHTE